MSNIKSEIDKWYENYIDELFAYGIAFGVEKDFVLDAIHDLFLHLFESADKIEILGSPKSYLFSALKNKIITSLRKQANWLSLDEEVEYDFKIEVDAEALMEDEEERRNYEKEVENLLNLLTCTAGQAARTSRPGRGSHPGSHSRMNRHFCDVCSWVFSLFFLYIFLRVPLRGAEAFRRT